VPGREGSDSSAANLLPDRAFNAVRIAPPAGHETASRCRRTPGETSGAAGAPNCNLINADSLPALDSLLRTSCSQVIA